MSSKRLIENVIAHMHGLEFSNELSEEELRGAMIVLRLMIRLSGYRPDAALAAYDAAVSAGGSGGTK